MSTPTNYFRGWFAAIIPGLALFAALTFSGPAPAALLGNTLNLPLIFFNPGETNYDSGSDTFSVDSTPVSLLSAPNTADFFNPGVVSQFSIRILVDASGALIGGAPGDDLVVVGEVDVPGTGIVSGVLLTGEVTEFGFQDSGGPTDNFDFSFIVTGGALAFLYPGNAIGVNLTSEGSSFTNFSVDFGGGAKGQLGGITPDFAALGDRAWEDLDADGVQDCTDSNGNGILGDVDPLDPMNPLVSDQGPECGDLGSGGAGIPGVTVDLYSPDGNGDCTINLGLQTVTGQDGFYLFENLVPGDYCVKFGQVPADFCDTGNFQLGAAKFTDQNVGADEVVDSDADMTDGTTDSVSLSAGETNRNLDAGYVCPAKIGDYVWEDLNQNGLQDAEPGVGGVTVQLYECGLDGIAGTADDINTGETRVTTPGDGMYMFGAEPGILDLPPGDYYVKFDSSTFPAGYDFTSPKIGGDDEIDSDCLPPSGIAACVTLGSRGINLRQDCGIVPPPPPVCDLEVDLLCRVEPMPSTMVGEKCEGKLQQFTVTWNGPGPVNITAVNMGTTSTSGPIENGDEVTFFGPYDSNDVVVDISGAVSGQSKFHVSCSDDNFNSPDDCGKLAGDGKGDDGGLLNLWLLEGFIDDNGDVLDCNPDPNGGEFSQNCSLVLPPAPDCESLGKPSSLTFEYSGGACPGDNDQGDKTKCSGTVDPAEMVTIGVNAGDDYMVSPSLVGIGETFTITRNGQEFKSNTDIELMNSGGTQLLEVHTSCSAPLAVGDQFGSITLVGYDGQSGGADVTLKYVVTNNGDPLVDIDVSDDSFGLVGTIGALGTNEMAMLTRLATINATTTTVATASASLGGLECKASDTVIVEELGPPPCEITPGEFKLEDDKIKWKLTNAGNDVATVESIEISAPDEFGAIKKVKLDGDIFKDDTRPMTWTFTDADFINDLKNRQIKVGDTKELLFETTEKFKSATFDQISITVNFEEGCSVTFVPGSQPFDCGDAKPIDSLSMIWNGPDGVDVVSPIGEVVNGVVSGQEVSFSGLSGLGNDVFWTVTGAVTGSSKFHVSCSDDDMNGPEDCGSPQGNGKDDDGSQLNLWLFEGMDGSNGIGLDCSAQ